MKWLQLSKKNCQNAKGKSMLDVEAIRKDFPILDQIVNDEPLVYLDNAATTQKPLAVLETINRYYEQDNANVHMNIGIVLLIIAVNRFQNC